MSYTEVYKNDADYQKIISEYEASKSDLQRKANYGSYKSQVLLEESAAIHSNLTNAITEHNQTRVSELKESMNLLKSGKNDVGYADRPNDVKEFEMRYKLANDNELQDLVNHLDSNDLLEINLLRMELKARNLDGLDHKIRSYVVRNRIDGMDEIEQKEYDYQENKLSAYLSVGARALVTGDSLAIVSNIDRELTSIAKSTDSVK